MTSTVPPRRGPLCIATQALRAWLLSACPSGDKSHLVDVRAESDGSYTFFETS
jgi:hypothetical protein